MVCHGRRWAILATATTVLCGLFISGCSPSYGFAKTQAGNQFRSEFCDSVRAFVRAPLDTEGLRRAWFLPFGVYEDGSFDFYAPMSSKPSDEVASEFYNQRVGQLTHYTTAPEFAFEFSGCLARGHGFTKVNRTMHEDTFSGSYVDDRLGREIELRARNDTTSIFVAGVGWTGDLTEAMTFQGAPEDRIE